MKNLIWLKRTFCLLLLTSSLLTFTSCESDDLIEEENLQNEIDKQNIQLIDKKDVRDPGDRN